MSYTKTVWRDGDVITAAKMNKIETGIEQSGGESPIIIDLGNFDDFDGNLELTIQTGLTPLQLLNCVIKSTSHMSNDTEAPIMEMYGNLNNIIYSPDYNLSITELYGLELFYYPETGLITTEQPNFASPNPPVQGQLA